MPYNTTAIPPRKEASGQTQLPLSRVKKIISVDPDIMVCSTNASFVITIAAEMFVQYLASEGQNMAKLERKPRRNLQYKDLANAALHQDNLEFLEDVIPKTTSFGRVKDQAAATQAKLRGEKTGEGSDGASLPAQPLANGRKSKSAAVNGTNGFGPGGAAMLSDDREDPNAQLEMEMREAERGADGDVDMME